MTSYYFLRAIAFYSRDGVLMVGFQVSEVGYHPDTPHKDTQKNKSSSLRDCMLMMEY